MWDAIGYVGSGITLVAFLSAVISSTYKRKTEERERLIKAAEPDERSDLVRNVLEFFHVDTAGLTKDQQFKVALEQIRARSQRFKFIIIIVGFLAIVAAAVSVFAIAANRPTPPVDDHPNTPSPDNGQSPQENNLLPPTSYAKATSPILVTAKREFTVGIIQPFDSTSDLRRNRLSVSVTARPGGRGARYKRAALRLNIPDIPAEQKVNISVDINIDGTGNGCASLKDERTNELLFEECKRTKRIALSLRNNVFYAVEVNASVNAGGGQTASRRTAVEFFTVN